MGRISKREVCAVNVRIGREYNRDYVELIEKIFSLKRGIRVHGTTYLAISSFDPESREGIFSKYTEIDTEGDWFNTDLFQVASDEDIASINLPREMKPNHQKFLFSLDVANHILVFESYNNPHSLSHNFVAKYLEKVLNLNLIKKHFGVVEADVVQDFSTVKAIIDLPNLRELKFTIKRPNPDDFNGDLRAVIEERLSAQNADELVEVFKTKQEDGIEPSERTRKLGGVAAQTGKVEAKSKQNGIIIPHSTANTPLRKSDQFDSEEGSVNPFRTLKARIVNTIRRSREDIGDEE